MGSSYWKDLNEPVMHMLTEMVIRGSLASSNALELSPKTLQ